MATKAKKQAAAYSCQSKEQTAEAIKLLGDVQRELVRYQTLLNDEIAGLTACAQPHIDALQERSRVLVDGIQVWCEANREAICGGGKTANLITGEVNWRQRPPSVRATKKIDDVIDTLRRLGLGRFVRTKEELNKEAVLAEPAAVAGIVGIAISSGIEDFAITPFEVEV